VIEPAALREEVAQSIRESAALYRVSWPQPPPPTD
jgi:hypothetical protein